MHRHVVTNLEYKSELRKYLVFIFHTIYMHIEYKVIFGI